MGPQTLCAAGDVAMTRQIVDPKAGLRGHEHKTGKNHTMPLISSSVMCCSVP